MADMIFADAARRFHGIPPDWPTMFTVPRRAWSLTSFVLVSSMGSLAALIEDTHPATTGIGILSVISLALTLVRIWKEDREKIYKQKWEDALSVIGENRERITRVEERAVKAEERADKLEGRVGQVEGEKTEILAKYLDKSREVLQLSHEILVHAKILAPTVVIDARTEDRPS